MQENKQEKSQIKQKILQYLANRGVSAYEFYKNSGVTRGILTQNNGINEDNIARFLAYAPDVSPAWLLTGEGEMLRSSFGEASESKVNQQVTMDPTVGTPFYDVDFFGSFTEIFNDQTVAPACYIIVPGFEKATVWCNVTGHSMEPKISHGDIIALHECTIDDIQYGEIYAVVLDTIRTIKIIRRGSSPDTLLYVPINKPDYEDQEFPTSRILKVFEVVGSISKFF
jgi:phage repressor protein C with HTH and peptisase S24 domain